MSHCVMSLCSGAVNVNGLQHGASSLQLRYQAQKSDEVTLGNLYLIRGSEGDLI